MAVCVLCPPTTTRWPILDPVSQVHPCITLGGGGNGLCVPHAKQVLRDMKRGEMDCLHPDTGEPLTLKGMPLDGDDPDLGLVTRIERVAKIWSQVSGSRPYT